MKSGTTFCGSNPDFPDDGPVGCCEGSAALGPQRCTCWEPVYDVEQQPARTDLVFSIAETPCHDCAYRADSPEKQGEDRYGADGEDLDAIVAAGHPFWCHQGMRKPTKLVHPSGAEAPSHEANYDPLIVDGRLYQANGEPAMLCAGWAARRQMYLKQQDADSLDRERS